MIRTIQTGVFGVLIFWMMLAFFRSSGADTNEILTTASEIRSLTTAEAAQKIPVCVTGVVTLTEPTWRGSFIMQDSTAGVFVTDVSGPPPVQGDLIEARGVSTPGGFTRAISLQQWKKLGAGPLPKAKPVPGLELMTGVEDANRVEVSGVVKRVNLNGLWLELQVASAGSHFRAYVTLSNLIDPNSLLEVPVCIRGTASTSINAKTKHLNILLFMPQESDLMIESTNSASMEGMLTTAEQVLSLTTAQAAEQIPVCVTGIVTGAQSNWGGRFFVQDSTGGVFVDSTNYPHPVFGDVVEVHGFTSPGGFAPDIEFPHFRKLGTAPLPVARPVSMEQFLSGSEDGERIELSGVITMAQVVKAWIEVEIKSGGDRAQAFIPLPPNLDPNSLIGATVRVRGTPAASFNATLRHLLTVYLYVPQDDDFIIDHLPDKAISQMPLTSLNHIAQYRRNSSLDSRIHVRGVVIYQRPGEDIFLHDNTGGLQVQSTDTNIFAPGDIVDAIGFPNVKGFLPVLEDAILYPTGKSETPLVPKKASMQQLIAGNHHADLISLKGKLLDRSLRPLPSANGLTNALEENVLTIKSDKNFFSVEAPATGEFAGMSSIPIGSTLEVSGVCLLQVDEEGEIENVQILPTSATSIRVLQRPGWWTIERLFVALGILLVVSLVGITWTVMIHRKNLVLKSSIWEKIKAQEELQRAHDQLESRVRERTKELKVEMSARKEAEIQYKAILTERTRLAQELHDTLLQGFTGIGLKLDALSNGLPPSLAATKEQLQKILKQSDEYLSEARRSVWALRSNSLKAPEDFPEALRRVSERALQSTSISLRFTTCGAGRKLAPEVEDNLLRICEEAVTNAVKHAAPMEVEVMLEYTDGEVRLWVRDNGRGFDPDGPDGTKAGHFGLVGIRERTKRLGGTLSLASEPGQGAEILITVFPSSES